METLLADPGIQKALAFVDADHENKLAELKEMTLMHGAPFHERELRSPMFTAKLEKYGATECFIDKHDNAFGYIRGGNGPLIVIEAHLDTVFEKNTPLAITEKDGVLHCPGIADDTAGLANILSCLRAIRHAGLVPAGSILIGGTAGEEGEGDIRGIKGLLDDHPGVSATIGLEPGPLDDIIYLGLGSRRWEFVFTCKGGHSWTAFGMPSAVHAQARATTHMANVRLPKEPRTSYTVGLVSGGTSVNSIAYEARMKLDMRSVSPEALMDVEKIMLALADKGAEEESAFWKDSGDVVTVGKILIGDRPAGIQPDDAPIVQTLAAAIKTQGCTPNLLKPISTNANAAISRGIPGIILRTGGNCAGLHSLKEWFDPNGSQSGVKAAILMLFALAGLPGVAGPIALK